MFTLLAESYIKKTAGAWIGDIVEQIEDSLTPGDHCYFIYSCDFKNMYAEEGAKVYCDVAKVPKKIENVAAVFYVYRFDEKNYILIGGNIYGDFYTLSTQRTLREKEMIDFVKFRKQIIHSSLFDNNGQEKLAALRN